MNIRTKSCCCSANKQKSIYDFEIMAMGGKSVSLADYKGKGTTYCKHRKQVWLHTTVCRP